MSSRSARALAAERKAGTPQKTKHNGVVADAATPPTNTENIKARDALVAIIPTEALALYTPLLAAFLAADFYTEQGHADRYMGLQWGLFFGALLLSVVLVGKGKKSLGSWPLGEMLAAGFAFAAWGLSGPGSPLLAETENKFDSYLCLSIAIGGAAVLAIFAKTTLTSSSK